MTRLLLVRHGQSVWNAERRWQGRADPPLSERGRRQAAAAQPDRADVVVTSPLRRAHETARIVAAGLGLTIAEIHDDLQEREAGAWTGLTRAQIAERTPGAPENGARPAGYEPDAEVWARARTRLLDLAVRYAGRTVLTVSHGGVISVIARSVDPAGARTLGPIPNLGGIALDVRDGRFGAIEAIHLSAAPDETRPGLE